MKQSSLDEDEEDFPGLLLHQAALWENAELLEDLLEGDQISHINSQDSWGRTPLHTAAMRDSGCLRVLLQAGADPNIQAGPRCENRTALHLSAENGFKDNILLLLAHKADITIRDCLNQTALDIAIKSDHQECVDILTKAQDARELSRHTAHQALREAVLSGDVNLVKVVLHELQPETELIVNLAPNGASTLLYCACESGKKALVRLLLDHGADGRCHPVTRYSPLYIASFKGHKEVVEHLLKVFPEQIQHHTVERWLPLHAAVINGHLALTEFLLKYSYPANLMTTFKEGEWEYEFPFDLNFKDVSGQTVLYLACFLGHTKLVDLLLKFKLKATRKPVSSSSGDKVPTSETEGPNNPDSPDILSPTRRRISDGIQSIMSRLSLGSKNLAQESNEKFLSPWHVNAYCNNGVETALHAAVGAGYHEIAVGLVNLARANVNLSTRPNSGDQSSSSKESVTPMVLACSNNDVSTVDLLLRAGARDDDCKALAVVVAARHDILTSKLLAIKAFPDPEYKINRKALAEMGGGGGVVYRGSIAANTPVMINWHAQRCELTRVRVQWLIDAGLHVNPKLRLQPRSQSLVLSAITRLDLSHNTLPWAAPALFQLPSLRVLNLASNKIERLPSPLSGDFELASPLHSAASEKKWGRGRGGESRGYWLPMLEELYLQVG
uniref:Leucine-rich repeat serine/threonine-protein kinase 1 n=2 Tax=Cacopsylla melanoneura TaxID=428564 RepID=A0A8D9F0T5_9HEMI